MNDDLEFLEVHAVRFARTLPIPDARRFLHGLLILAGSDQLSKTRVAYTSLTLADDQLELIASPQLRLPLDGGDGEHPTQPKP